MEVGVSLFGGRSSFLCENFQISKILFEIVTAPLSESLKSYNEKRTLWFTQYDCGK